MKYLIIVDMQNDFITGPLGTGEAREIIPAVIDKILRLRSEGYRLIFTQDTHSAAYLNTREGAKLPVPHCLKGTPGWEICPPLSEYSEKAAVAEKDTFGSKALVEMLENPEIIELCGVCTDICVISNALLLRAFFPEAEIRVDGACCAGVTPDSHQTALDAMKACQIEII